VNIGNRPTVYGRHGVKLLEVHLLDFAGDLYGCSIGVELVSRVRAERRFSSLDELKAQLARDVEDARHRLGVSG
jgi:riboflavin kinase/FMN adenylyltransferase